MSRNGGVKAKKPPNGWSFSQNRACTLAYKFYCMRTDGRKSRIRVVEAPTPTSLCAFSFVGRGLVPNHAEGVYGIRNLLRHGIGAKCRMESSRSDVWHQSAGERNLIRASRAFCSYRRGWRPRQPVWDFFLLRGVEGAAPYPIFKRCRSARDNRTFALCIAKRKVRPKG